MIATRLPKKSVCFSFHPCHGREARSDPTQVMIGAAADDDALIADLQVRLKPARGGQAPKPKMLQAALALARDPALAPSRVAPSGGHVRARELAEKLIELGVVQRAVAVAANKPVAEAATVEADAAAVREVLEHTIAELERVQKQGT